MKKLICFLCAAMLLLCSACGSEPTLTYTPPSQSPTPTATPSASPSPEREDSAPEETAEDEDLLAGIDLPRAEIIQIYNETEALLEDPSSPAFATEYDVDAVDAYEDAAIQSVADAHGITPEEVDQIYIAGAFGELYDFDATSFTLKYGTLLDTTINGTMLVIKAKIEPSLTDDLTISQNYFNVCDIIKNQGGDQFDTISYWAVADMTSGEESKVISFDVDADTINLISSSDEFADNTLGEYVDNLWKHPSLQS